jgi:hypothetical protein
MGFSGFCAKARATTELAARLLLMAYNLWTLFVRFIAPHKHTEAKRPRWFLLIAARLVQSGRQRSAKLDTRRIHASPRVDSNNWAAVETGNAAHGVNHLILRQNRRPTAEFRINLILKILVLIVLPK